jgi:hypothetical protein
MLPAVGILVGFVLLVFGRRLYWVFVAGIGFVTGLWLAPRLLPEQPEWLILVAALALALAGALLALVAQTVMIALVGFLAGGATGVLVLHMLGADSGVLTWLVYLAGGVVGVVLVLALFEWGLIALSSLAGSSLMISGVSESIPLTSRTALVAVIAVAVIGVIVQATWSGAPPRRRHGERRA